MANVRPKRVNVHLWRRLANKDSGGNRATPNHRAEVVAAAARWWVGNGCWLVAAVAGQQHQQEQEQAAYMQEGSQQQQEGEQAEQSRVASREQVSWQGLEASGWELLLWQVLEAAVSERFPWQVPETAGWEGARDGWREVGGGVRQVASAGFPGSAAEAHLEGASDIGAWRAGACGSG